MTVAVLGLGYVGCVTACCLARDGHDVVGVDINTDKVAMINAGQSPLVEPGLDELLARVVHEQRLSATDDIDIALATCDVALICVGTPDAGHGQQDLSSLARVADAIGRAAAVRSRPMTVVLRSTVLPGTTEKVLLRAISENPAARSMVRIAMNPEFMREGSALSDFCRPPFVIIGSDDPRAVTIVRRLYARVDAPVIETSIPDAEMIKYACNAYHALKVCFGNEIAELCDALGADGQRVMSIVCQDRKLNISPAYLKPGFAFGGSCLPKDVRALSSVGRMTDVEVPLLNAIVPSNETLIRRGIDTVLQTRKRKVGVVGLAFKPTSDDLRESPMVAMAEALIGKGCDVRIYDPAVVLSALKGANRAYIQSEIPHIASLLCEDVSSLLAHAEVLVFGTPGAEAARVRAAASEQHTIVDLTHGSLAAQVAPEAVPSRIGAVR